MPMDITRTAPWQALLAHREQLRPHHLRELFAREPARFEKLSFRLGDFLADFSKQRITPETLGLLTDLARAADVEGWRDRMFAGERINVSEQRAVLHPALRFLGTGPFPSAAKDVMPEVRAVRAQMAAVFRAGAQRPVARLLRRGHPPCGEPGHRRFRPGAQDGGPGPVGLRPSGPARAFRLQPGRGPTGAPCWRPWTPAPPFSSSPAKPSPPRKPCATPRRPGTGCWRRPVRRMRRRPWPGTSWR